MTIDSSRLFHTHTAQWKAKKKDRGGARILHWDTEPGHRRRREGWGLGRWYPAFQSTKGPGKRRELPQWGPERSLGRQRILAYFRPTQHFWRREPQALHPNKASFFVKIHSIDEWGHDPCRSPSGYALKKEEGHTIKRIDKITGWTGLNFVKH